MKNFVLFLGVILILAIGYWLISPLFISKQVNESLDELVSSQPQESARNSDQDESGAGDATESDSKIETLKNGIFEGRSNHRASGSVSLVTNGEGNFVRIEEDFDAENGPDLFVHLGKDGRYDPNVNLGRLKGNKGSQNYAIPSQINLDEYDEVWIWCRAFTVPFAQAVLQ